MYEFFLNFMQKRRNSFVSSGFSVQEGYVKVILAF